LVRCHADDGAPLEEAIVYKVVELGGKHALDVALDVAQDEAVAFLALALGFGIELFHLETLEDRD